MTVPGQVQASNEHFYNIGGMPIEKDIAKVVRALPATVKGKLMSETLRPCMETDQVIKFSIEQGKWNFFQVADTFSVQDTSTKEPYAGGVYVKEITNIFGGHRIVVYDGSKKPIALAVQDLKEEFSKTYTIYATIQIYETDKVEHTEDGVAFYPWFCVRDKDEHHLDFRALLGWNGAHFQPMFRIMQAAPKAEDRIGAIDSVPTRKGDIIVVDNNDQSIQYALLSKQGAGQIAGWHVCVAPGVDPLAMLTLAAVMDTMVGWFKDATVGGWFK